MAHAPFRSRCLPLAGAAGEDHRRGELSPGPGLEGGRPGAAAASSATSAGSSRADRRPEVARPPPSGRPPSAGWPPWPWPRPTPSSGRLAPAARRADRAQGPARGGADAAERRVPRRAGRGRRTPEQLQAALPRDAALIDVLEYTHFSPPPERKGELKSERRLVAFVVRPDRPIARVELGPLAPIGRRSTPGGRS